MNGKQVFHRASVALVNRVVTTPRTSAALFNMVAVHDHWGNKASEEARFLAFCASLRHLAFGQLLQDLWVLFESDLRTGGCFVEFGAHDGTTHSNTRLLEERFGWRGVLAEPNPGVVDLLRSSRTAAVDPRCVWDVSGASVDLTVTADSELSTVLAEALPDLHTALRAQTAQETISVATVSLDDLLAEHAVPEGLDFLSVDTEGTELRILRAFDIARYRPRLVAVEHNGRDDEAELDDLMTAAGYERRFRSLSDWDGWYRRIDPSGAG